MVLAMLSAFSFSLRSHAQIAYPTGDDLFDSTTCCTNVTPALPVITGPTTLLGNLQPGQFGILEDCFLLNNYAVDVTVNIFPHPGGMPIMTPPTGLPACDEFVIQVVVAAAGGGGGFMVIGASPTVSSDRRNFVLAKFVRTWIALGPNGTTLYRYWRYMVEGDAVGFSSSPTIPSSAFPSCWSTTSIPDVSFDKVVFRGYLDLMRPVNADENFITANGQAFSLVMSHYDGCLDHLNAPLLNTRALVPGIPTKHVGRSYHLVTPNNFSWVTNAPSPSQLDFNNIPQDSLRSTVSHTTLTNSMGQSPGPLCLAEMPLTARTTTNAPTCNCVVVGGGNPGALDFNQTFPAPSNYGVCGTQKLWNSYVLTPEIPTGFTQTYLGFWNSLARPDVLFVKTTFAVGTIAYADHCAYSRGYLTNDEHIVWGNASLWPSATAPNAPTIEKEGIPFATDYMLHFGNHVDGVDDNLIGEPAYVNVIWNMFR